MEVEFGRIDLEWRTRLGDVGRTERRFLDFIIDGQSLWESLGTDFVSCLGWLPAEHNEVAVRRLLLEAPADFPDNRRSLYICPECADLGCGAVSVVIERSGDNVIWKEFGFQNNYDGEVHRDEYSDYPTIAFDSTEYIRVIASTLENQS